MGNRSSYMPMQDIGIETHSFPGNVTPDVKIPAEARVVRLMNIEADTSEIDAFLNRAGRLTYGAGRVVASGSLAVTYVDAQEMGQMIEAKFPGMHNEPKKIKNLHNRLRKDFQAFVRSQGTAVDHNLLRVLVEPDAGDVDLSSADYDSQMSDYEDEQSRLRECTEQIWHDADVAIGGIGLFGKTGLAFNLSGNEVLMEERREVANYLSAEGFRANQVMNAGWLPHATFYYATRHISALSLPKAPSQLTLDAPTMLIR